MAEPTAAERHEFVDTDSSVLNADETLWVGVCAVCRSAEDDPVHQPAAVPHRLCCGKQHLGVTCPDGLVMCCLCFDRFNVADLRTLPGGQRENVCLTCATNEARHQPATSSGQEFHPTPAAQSSAKLDGNSEQQTAEHGIDTAAIRADARRGYAFFEDHLQRKMLALCDALDRQREEQREMADRHLAILVELREQRDEAREETARLREQVQRTEHDFQAAHAAALRAQQQRDDDRDLAAWEAVTVALRAAGQSEPTTMTAVSHAIRRITDQRDDARARLKAIEALCDLADTALADPRINIADIRAILATRPDPVEPT